MATSDRTEEYYMYMNDIYELVKCLNKKRLFFYLRLSPAYKLKNLQDNIFFRKILPIDQIDEADDNIYNIEDKYKLLVFTYDSSGFLEFLTLNRPVILYQPNIMSVLNKISVEEYQKLINVNIIFLNKEQLSNFLDTKINSLYEWWNCKKTTEARIQFCNKYSQLYSEKKLIELSEHINESVL